MDLGARLVTVDLHEVQLANKEFELLRVLMSRAGQVVSRDEILAEVWNDLESKTSKTLDMHMSWLRRKLSIAADDAAGRTSKAHDGERRIATVRGVGFRFNAE
jgi:DNA-binding response OmpR family regulator